MADPQTATVDDRPRPGRTRRSPRVPLDPDNVRVLILVALTAVTGSVDAASYLGIGHVFTANMTGNVVLLGLAAGGAALPLARSAIALAAFVIGTIVAGRMVRGSETSTTWPSRLLATLALSFGCLAAAFLLWIGHGQAPLPDLLAVLLAFAMGVQGAAVRALGVADLPTTVITSTLTGLGADSRLAGGNSVRWRRRAGAVIAVCAGGLAGALLLRIDHALALAPALAIQLAVAAFTLARGLHRAPISAP